MKTLTNEGQDLTSIGTVVFYRWHPYLPDEIKNLSIVDTLLEDSKSSKILHLSDNASSDLVEFAEYNFDYKVDKTKYKKYLKANYFDRSTREKIGIEYNKLKWMSDCMFPQKSKEVTEIREDNYFGMITVSNQSVVLLDVPGEIWELIKEEEKHTPGVWKVEIYNQQIESNNNEYGGFIEHDTLKFLGKYNSTLDPTPALTIVLGPDPNIKNNSEDMYYQDGIYNDLGKITLTTSEYMNLWQEITDRKIIYIVVSSDGTLKDINLSYSAWTQTPNPNRNQKDYSLRNDYFFETRDSIKITGNFLGSNMIHDKTSHTLLGTKKLNISSDCPIISSKISRAKGIYSPNVLYNEGDKIVVNGRTWRSSISGNIGQDPEYSNYWTLDQSEEWSIQNSDYIHIFVSSNSKEYGEISPVGNITIKENSEVTFIVKPNLGYSFPIQEEIDKGKSTTDLIKVGAEPFFCNNITVDGDKIKLRGIDKPSNVKIFFQPVKSRVFFEMYVAKDWIKNEGNEAYYRYPNFALDTKLITAVNGKIVNLDENGLLLADIGDKVQIKVDTSESDYILQDFWYQDELGEYHTVLPDKDGSIYIDNVNFSYRAYQINLSTRKYECKVISYEGGEINKYGEYLDWGKSFVLKFYEKPGYEFVDVKLYYANSGELVNDSSVYRVDSSSEVKSLTIISVTSDFNIELIFRKI